MFTLAQKGGVQFSMLTSSRLALLVAYDGTPYRGWTDVRDSVLRPTLQRVLRSADDELPLIESASRTDAGVHAFGQVCSLSLASRKAELDTGQLRYSLNQLLPPEVVVRGCKVMDADFDVRANVAMVVIDVKRKMRQSVRWCNGLDIAVCLVLRSHNIIP